jgi:DNA-binding Lrp family transcriptional regulator
MEKAFLCINCKSGHEKEVIDKLNKLTNVEARGTLGVFDIVAIVSSDSLDTMRKLVTEQVRKINGITSTITLLEAEKESGIPDLIPDVIPEEKKPLEPPEEIEEEEDWDEEDDYEEARKDKF